MFSLTHGAQSLFTTFKREDVITPYSDFNLFLNAEYLNFSNYGLTELPSGLLKLKHLKALDISNNKLIFFPVELAQLPKLQELYYQGNPFSEIEPFHSLHTNSERITFLRTLRGNPAIPPPPFSYRLDPSKLQEYPEAGYEGDVQNCISKRLKSNQQLLDIIEKDPSIFSLFSFNILAQGAIRKGLYPYTSPMFLSLDYRVQLLCKQISQVNPDIFFFQELQTSVYQDTLKPNLSSRGYEGCFAPKGRYYRKPPEEQPKVYGQAIFWKSNKFLCISTGSAELADVACQEGEHKFDDVATYALLQLHNTKNFTRTDETYIFSSKVILFINIHLIYIYQLDDVRAAYIKAAVQLGLQFAAQNGFPSPAVIIAGDFNSQPNSLPIIALQEHPLKFRSAYDDLGWKLNPTIYMQATVRRVDHIMHTNELETVGALNVPTTSEMEKYCYFPPSQYHPSDHLPIGAVFRLI